MTMTLVSTTTVGSGGAASITFSSIPQTGKDLLLVLSARCTDATANAPVKVTLNSDTGNNYSARNIRGSGSAIATFVYTSTSPLTFLQAGAASGTSNTFSNDSLYIANYTSTTAKRFLVNSVSENNSATAFDSTHYLWAAKYNNSTGITTILLEDNYGGNFVQYSTASLYIIS